MYTGQLVWAHALLAVIGDVSSRSEQNKMTDLAAVAGEGIVSEVGR